MQPVIVWFRQDLRLSDNPALDAAAQTGAPILPIYVLDDGNASEWRMGGASRWWLHESLLSLNRSLQGHLRFFCGTADTILLEILQQAKPSHIFWNRCYEPWRIKRDSRIKAKLVSAGCKVVSHSGSLLFEPHTIAKADGTPYKVFTPYYKKGCLRLSEQLTAPLPAPEDLSTFDAQIGISLEDLNLLPAIHWHHKIAECWSPGEFGANERLGDFLSSAIENYAVGRDRPDQDSVSRLSPHFHFGEISPRQVWFAAKAIEANAAIARNIEHFLRELAWREFSYYLLYHFPQLPRDNLQKKFDVFPWRNDEEVLSRWQQGQTGFPFVDAGMRELWQTGYMHNRVRMIVGSFLVKNLLLHWHHGENWFWDTLVDADLASNSASWQWVSGCGTDAAPYFRIFNPVTQGQKFDPNGDYVRRFIPELTRLPTKYIHNPWAATKEVRDEAGVVLGKSYPHPMLDLKASRERALAAFQEMRSAA